MDQLFSFLMDSSWIFLLGWCLVLLIAYLTRLSARIGVSEQISAATT